MVYLGDVAHGRDNNFNLIRALAATAVLVSHAYPIALGPGAVQPLQNGLGHTLGSLAVAVFFVISGFLIPMSFERSRGLADFVVARVLRLYPALVVSLLAVAFLMGPLVTSLAPADYLADSGTFTFMVRNLLLIVPQYTLPGVFVDNPYPDVEGSIWTLFYEVVCYAGVFAVGVAGILRRRGVMALLVCAFLLVWIAAEIMDPGLHRIVRNTLDLALPFALGMVLYVWRDHVPLSLTGVVLTAAIAWMLKDTPLYTLALTVALGYATFWVGFVPGGILRAYNRVGDYSYGIYIYAFPAQGLAVWLAGPMTPFENMVWALPLTILPSILSWHLVEKPALAQRRWFSSFLGSARPTEA